MSFEQVSSLVDLDRYPIHQTGSAAYHTAFEQIQNDLNQDGCAVLENFIREDALPLIVDEADKASVGAYPKRRFYDRSNAFIPADYFGEESLLRTLYEWAPLSAFLQSVLEEENFYPYGDPLADVIINQAEEGGGFPWHFDTNNFTVTLALQNADEGGEFEYAPAIRTAADENFDEVAGVLDGTSDKIKRLVLGPGDLQLFKGRYSLHRVAPLKGQTKRYVGIFSYVEKPGMCGSVERTKQLYGRVLPIHYEREGLRADNLLD